MTEPKQILVTGGAGFIGSNLVKVILARLPKAKVTVLDDFYTGHRDNIPENPRVNVVEGSVTDTDLVQSLVDGTDLVFHLAAHNISASMKDPRNDYEVNVGGTLNVLLAARDAGGIRVVYSSSASVYGNPRHLPIHEDESLSTLSPYSVSKLAGENYCQAFYESYGLPTTALRYSNVYGPGPRGVMYKFMHAAMTSEPLKIHGNGEQTRDFTFVGDVVEATLRAGITPHCEGQVINVATGIETSINQLAHIITEVCGSSSVIEHVENRDIDNIRRRVLNIERLRRVLRFIPRQNLVSGLRQTADWYRSTF